MIPLSVTSKLRSVFRNRARRRSLAIPEPRAPIVNYARELTLLLDEAERYVITETRKEEAFRADALSVITAFLERLEVYFRDRFGRNTAETIARRVEREIEASNWRSASRILGINPLERETGLGGQRDQFIDENVALIRGLGDAVKAELADLIEEATAGQIRHEELAKRIQERFNVGKSRAQLIARDQTLKHNAALTRTRHRNLGINEYIWDTSGDERVRDSHAEVDGKRFSYDAPPVLSDGFQGHPGEAINCRCVAIPVIE